jgi:hypothetical protein
MAASFTEEVSLGTLARRVELMHTEKHLTAINATIFNALCKTRKGALHTLLAPSPQGVWGGKDSFHAQLGRNSRKKPKKPEKTLVAGR